MSKKHIKGIKLEKCPMCNSKVIKIITDLKKEDGSEIVYYEQADIGDISIGALIEELKKKVK